MVSPSPVEGRFSEGDVVSYLDFPTISERRVNGYPARFDDGLQVGGPD